MFKGRRLSVVCLVTIRVSAAALGLVLAWFACGPGGEALAAGVSGAAGELLVLHVSPAGRDDWSGAPERPNPARSDGPLASIAGARDRIRALRARAGGLKQPVRVVIADGTYRIGETIVFTAEDSGSRRCPIAYQAADGARPVISGGRVVTGWKRTPGKDLWEARVAGVREGRVYFRQLFVGGRRYLRARRPTRPGLDRSGDRSFRLERVRTILPPEKGFVVLDKMDTAFWRPGDEVELVLTRVWDISRFRVTAFDEKSRLVRFRHPNERILAHPDGRYWLENSLAFLDEPGEWFLDRKTGVVYLQPMKGERPDRTEVLFPVLRRLVLLRGEPQRPVRHIEFRGLTFSHASWELPPEGYDGHGSDPGVGAGLEADYADSIAFVDCRFLHMGANGVWLRRRCTNAEIRGCEFADLGAGAVKIGPYFPRHRLDDGTDVSTDNVVSGNHVHHCGHVWPSSPGIYVTRSRRITIARNHLHHLTYSGIAVRGLETKTKEPINHLVEFNYVHNVMQFMADGGGIYLNGPSLLGTVIRNNLIHDVLEGWRSWNNGMYLDDLSSDLLVENNLVYCIGRWSFVMGDARRNVIRNNIFALSGQAQLHSRKGRDNVFEGNIVLAANLLFDNTWDPRGTRARRNLYYVVDGLPASFPGKMTFAEWQSTGHDAHSIFADPRFVDFDKGDFSLGPDSPALKLGFKPFKLPRAEPVDPGSSILKRLKSLSLYMKTRPPEPMAAKEVPRLRVGPPASEIVVDGRGSEKAWSAIRPVALQEVSSEGPPRHRVRVACDGAYLYVLLENDVPEKSELRARDARWPLSDGAEVCFQGIYEKEWTSIYVVRGYACGVFESATEAGARPYRARRIEKQGQYAATVTENGWVGEWKIPLKPVHVRPFELKEFRFNVAARRAARRKWAMLFKTGAESWRLHRAGLLVVQR